MAIDIIKDWTESEVPMKYGPARRVRYRVYRQGEHLFQEIRDVDDAPIHALQLPDGMALESSSYAVLLRYVVVEVVNS